MAITTRTAEGVKLFVSKPAPVRKPRAVHARKEYYKGSLSDPGRLTVGNLMALFCVSHSALYARMKTHRIPPPDGYDGPRPFWNTETIRAIRKETPLERGARIARARETERQAAEVRHAAHVAANAESLQTISG